MIDKDWVTVDGVRYEPRHKVIEECALVAERAEYDAGASTPTCKDIAAAIRALKDKP